MEAVTGLLSYDFAPETTERLKPRLDDQSISVSLAAADYLVRTGEGAATIAAFTRGLESDILWARIRAGAYLSYRNREELRPLAPLLPALRAGGGAQGEARADQRELGAGDDLREVHGKPAARAALPSAWCRGLLAMPWAGGTAR